MNKLSKIFVAGHKGTVGSAVVRNLSANGYEQIIVVSSKELDLRHQQSVNDFFKKYEFKSLIRTSAHETKPHAAKNFHILYLIMKDEYDEEDVEIVDEDYGEE